MHVLRTVPGPFEDSQIKEILSVKSQYNTPEYYGFPEKTRFINSGTNGLRLLLQQLNIFKGAYVGVSPLICSTVIDAIELAGLSPYFIDIDETFQLHYDEELFDSLPIKALILPHLYGTAHPQFAEIMIWSEKRNIPVIQDAAQSFGVQFNGKSIIEYGVGGVISFGPGKTSMSAGGAIVLSNLKEINSIKQFNWGFNSMARLFIKSRSYTNLSGQSKWTKLLFVLYKYVNRLFFLSLTPVQHTALQFFQQHIDQIKVRRNENWTILRTGLNEQFFKVPMCYENVSKYKFVFYLDMPKEVIDEFIQTVYVQGFNIRREPKLASKYHQLWLSKVPYYENNWYKLLEISTEASIPGTHFTEMAQLINSYFIQKQQ